VIRRESVSTPACALLVCCTSIGGVFGFHGPAVGIGGVERVFPGQTGFGRRRSITGFILFGLAHSEFPFGLHGSEAGRDLGFHSFEPRVGFWPAPHLCGKRQVVMQPLRRPGPWRVVRLSPGRWPRKKCVVVAMGVGAKSLQRHVSIDDVLALRAENAPVT